VTLKIDYYKIKKKETTCFNELSYVVGKFPALNLSQGFFYFHRSNIFVKANM